MNKSVPALVVLSTSFFFGPAYGDEQAEADAQAEAAAQAAAAMARPYTVKSEDPIYMQADGFEWDHEIIVVSVGHRHTDPMSEFMRKRTVDLFWSNSSLFRGPAIDVMKASLGDEPNVLFAASRGAEFFNFLVDDVRPALAEKYRMADDHAVFGHSAGGGFVSRAIFERPGAFKRFIVGSGTDFTALEKEAAYAAANDDMDARIFFGAGDLEANDVFGSSQRLVSNPLLLQENLRLRSYPSLAMELRLYRGRDHATVAPLTISDGLIFIYEDLVETQ